MTDEEWRRGIEDVAARSARDLAEIQELSSALVIDMLRHPENHSELHADGTVGVPTTRELLRVASDAVADLRLTLDKSAEMLTTYAALIGSSDGHDPADRADDEDPPRRGSKS